MIGRIVLPNVDRESVLRVHLFGTNRTDPLACQIILLNMFIREKKVKRDDDETLRFTAGEKERERMDGGVKCVVGTRKRERRVESKKEEVENENEKVVVK